MKRDLAYYESLLETICDEINIKELVIQSPYKGLKVIYYHDTIKGGGYSEVVYNDRAVDAPKTAVILIQGFLKQQT